MRIVNIFFILVWIFFYEKDKYAIFFFTVKEVFGLTMIFKRNYNSYLLSYFIPVSSLTLICSASFFISPDSIPGRVGMLLTIELVMINLYIAVRVSIFFFFKIWKFKKVLKNWILLIIGGFAKAYGIRTKWKCNGEVHISKSGIDWFGHFRICCNFVYEAQSMFPSNRKQRSSHGHIRAWTPLLPNW